jgi:hypothetical protein
MDNEMYIMLKEIKKDVTPTADEIRYHREHDLEIDERAHHMTILQADLPSKCKECVEQGVKCWYHYVFQKLDEWCNKDDKCPIKKRVCKLKDEHPKVLAGLLYIWGQPTTSEYFFCMGENLCDVPKEQAIDQLKETFDYMTIDDSSSWGKLEQDGQCELEIQSPEYDDPCVGDDCPKKCIKKVSCCVMKYYIDKVKKWCKKATKDCDKKRCEWMRNHKEFTFGVLLAYVQPWKFAIGYCHPHPDPTQELDGPTQELDGNDESLEFGDGMFLA